MGEPNYVDWRINSRCAKLNPEQYDKLFFPSSGRSINKAKKFCGKCKVQDECLESALASGAEGIWAGTNKSDRVGILNFRNQLNKPVVISKQRVSRKIVKRTNLIFN
jgi:hypothetical protein